jgi:hypothetical protein
MTVAGFFDEEMALQHLAQPVVFRFRENVCPAKTPEKIPGLGELPGAFEEQLKKLRNGPSKNGRDSGASSFLTDYPFRFDEMVAALHGSVSGKKNRPLKI